MNKNLNVGIIGAGIQGISNALFLQKKGYQVTLFDRENLVVLSPHMAMLVTFHHTHPYR